MPNPVQMLDEACEAFRHNSVGQKLLRIRAILNEAKSDYNAHTHTAGGQPPSATIGEGAVAAIDNAFELNVCCAAMQQISDFFVNTRNLVNDIRTVYNAHTHTAEDTGPGTSITAASLAINQNQAQAVAGQCPALGYQGDLGTIADLFTSIVNLANELKSDFNAHTHPTALTNPTASTTSSTNVGSIY